jgi:hypothetical protein
MNLSDENDFPKPRILPWVQSHFKMMSECLSDDQPLCIMMKFHGNYAGKFCQNAKYFRFSFFWQNTKRPFRFHFLLAGYENTVFRISEGPMPAAKKRKTGVFRFSYRPISGPKGLFKRPFFLANPFRFLTSKGKKPHFFF